MRFPCYSIDRDRRAPGPSQFCYSDLPSCLLLRLAPKFPSPLPLLLPRFQRHVQTGCCRASCSLSPQTCTSCPTLTHCFRHNPTQPAMQKVLGKTHEATHYMARSVLFLQFLPLYKNEIQDSTRCRRKQEERGLQPSPSLPPEQKNTMKTTALFLGAAALASSNEFESFSTQFRRSYANETERAFRQGVFAANMAKAHQMNAGARALFSCLARLFSAAPSSPVLPRPAIIRACRGW